MLLAYHTIIYSIIYSISLSLSFSLFLSLSLHTGLTPNTWKTAHIIPIHKKGPTSSLSNYRPISLTCTCWRVQEKIINEKILQHLISHNLISPQQHGFRPLKSTTTNLLECVYHWTSSQQRRRQIDTIYFDFQKAFDSASHPKLLNKVQPYGITGNWF